jgi:hypothetical protein
MRLFTPIKALTDAASGLVTDIKTRSRPSTAQQQDNPRERSCSNLTHDQFSVFSPSVGSIARRRSNKWAASTTTIEDKQPLLHTEATTVPETPPPLPDADLSSTTAAFTFRMKPPPPHHHHHNHHHHHHHHHLNPYFPPPPPPPPREPSLTRKRKRELDDVVRRVKSVKLSVSSKRLRDLFDEEENDRRRYQLRTPALEASEEPLRDGLRVATSAEAMRRSGAVMNARKVSLPLGGF